MQSTTRPGWRPRRSPTADEDPSVGLVIDEQVDVIQTHARGLGGLQRGQRQAGDRLAKRLVAAHPDQAVIPADPDVIGAGAVGAEDHRADPAAALRGLQHDRTGAVGEHGRGGAILGIDHPRHQIGADHDRAAGAAGFDLRRPDRQRRQKAGARGVDVEGAGAGRAQRMGDQRRRAGHQLIRRGGGDDHQIDVQRVHRRPGQSLSRRRRGVVSSRSPGSAIRRGGSRCGARSSPRRLPAGPRSRHWRRPWWGG